MNEKLQEIRWHAERLQELLMPEAEKNMAWAELHTVLGATIIDNRQFEKVDPTPPEM